MHTRSVPRPRRRRLFHVDLHQPQSHVIGDRSVHTDKTSEDSDYVQTHHKNVLTVLWAGIADGVGG
jgi:hypothetical protein